jgi:hypothetical protein
MQVPVWAALGRKNVDCSHWIESRRPEHSDQRYRRGASQPHPPVRSTVGRYAEENQFPTRALDIEAPPNAGGVLDLDAYDRLPVPLQKQLGLMVVVPLSKRARRNLDDHHSPMTVPDGRVGGEYHPVTGQADWHLGEPPVGGTRACEQKHEKNQAQQWSRFHDLSVYAVTTLAASCPPNDRAVRLQRPAIRRPCHWRRTPRACGGGSSGGPRASYPRCDRHSARGC